MNLDGMANDNAPADGGKARWHQSERHTVTTLNPEVDVAEIDSYLDRF